MDIEIKSKWVNVVWKHQYMTWTIIKWTFFTIIIKLKMVVTPEKILIYFSIGEKCGSRKTNYVTSD